MRGYRHSKFYKLVRKLFLIVCWIAVVTLGLLPTAAYFVAPGSIGLNDLSLILIGDLLIFLPTVYVMTFGTKRPRPRPVPPGVHTFELNNPIFTMAGLLLTTLGLAMLSILGWGFIFQSEGIDTFVIVMLLVMGLGLLIPGMVWIVRHHGRLLLTSDEIVLERLGRTRSVRYANVTNLTTGSNAVIPDIIIDTDDGRTLRISTQAGNANTIFALLRQHVRLPEIAAPGAEFPWVLELPRKYYVKVALYSLALIGFFGILAFAADPGFNNPGLYAFIGGFLFVILLIAFVAGLAGDRQPKRLVFTPETIEACYFLRGCRQWRVAEITSIKHQAISRYNAPPLDTVTIAFSDGSQLDLNANRALELGLHLRDYHENLLRFYEERFTARKIPQLLALVRAEEAIKIEAARSYITTHDIPHLLDAYHSLETWEEKAGMMQLLFTHVVPIGHDVMLDFLRAPCDLDWDDYVASGKVVAICQLEGSFANYESYWDDREALAAAIRRHLETG